tara:strand:- start:408 stop:611 length:204 start_codon:yes stop_codon:yes gene_type:complete
MNKDTLKVTQNEDGTFMLEWDPDDDNWSWLNTMTEEQISQIISEHSKEVLSNVEINSIITNDSLDAD